MKFVNIQKTHLQTNSKQKKLGNRMKSYEIIIKKHTRYFPLKRRWVKSTPKIQSESTWCGRAIFHGEVIAIGDTHQSGRNQKITTSMSYILLMVQKSGVRSLTSWGKGHVSHYAQAGFLTTKRWWSQDFWTIKQYPAFQATGRFFLYTWTWKKEIGENRNNRLVERSVFTTGKIVLERLVILNSNSPLKKKHEQKPGFWSFLWEF